MVSVASATTRWGLWSVSGAAAPPVERMDGDVVADVAIVGGGYCGLSAALHLAEAGVEPVVLEAEEPGWGASGRNGGQVIAGLKVEPTELAHKFGEAPGRALHAFGATTADLVFSIVERFQIACEAHRNGWIQAGRSPQTLADVKRRARELRDAGDAVEWLDAQRVAELTGTGFYQGGLIDRRSGSVQPLSYVRGLAAAATAMGARIIAGARVTRLAPENGRWRLETPKGRVVARRVLLAANGYIGELYPAFARSMIVIESYQVATDPLPPDIDRAVLPARVPVSDLADLGIYFRRDDDGRFVVGGIGTFTDRERPQLFAETAKAACILYPALSDVPFTTRWGGKVTLTRDHLPRLLEPEPGLFVAYGCQGRGVALQTAIGQLAAGYIRDAGAERLPIATAPPEPYPFHRFRVPVMEAARAWHRLRRNFATS